MRRQKEYGDGPHRSAALTPPGKPPFDWNVPKKIFLGSLIVWTSLAALVGAGIFLDTCHNAQVAEEHNERNRCEDWCSSRVSSSHQETLEFWGTRPYHDPHQAGQYFRCHCASRMGAQRFDYICRVEGELVCVHE